MKGWPLLPSESQAFAGKLRLILASASPRRHELLALLGYPFSVIITDAEDSQAPVPPEILAALPPYPLPSAQHPTLLAWRKAQAVAELEAGDIVLGADTVVVLEAALLGKPRDSAEAEAMLTRLAGQVHTVYTGLAVWAQRPQKWAFALVASEVTLAPLAASEIAAYVATGEPLDKAGAYGLQGLGGRLVRQVQGSFTAVVGLPLPPTVNLLTEAGLAGLADPTIAYHQWLQSQGKEPFPCPPTFP